MMAIPDTIQWGRDLQKGTRASGAGANISAGIAYLEEDPQPEENVIRETREQTYSQSRGGNIIPTRQHDTSRLSFSYILYLCGITENLLISVADMGNSISTTPPHGLVFSIPRPALLEFHLSG